MRSFWLIFALLGSLMWMAGCGSSSGSTPVGVANITVSLTPSTAQNVKAGGTLNIVASVANDPNGAGVNWSFSPNFGSLTNETTSSATYAAPTSVTSNTAVTVTAASITNPSSTASLQITVLQGSGQLAVSLSTGSAWSTNQTVPVTITASVANDASGKGVSWSISPASGAGTLTSESTTSATYNPPATATNIPAAIVKATSIANTSVAAAVAMTVIPSSGSNVLPVVVDGGGATIEGETGVAYPDGGFATVTVCEPGTSSCNTIDHVLVDTGSYGLRVLTLAAGGELTVSLPQEQVGGNGLSSCISFVDGSYLWGNVATADITLGTEVAQNVPVQLVQDPTPPLTIPTSCSNGGTDEDTLGGLLANGILGVGPEPTDCTIAGTNFCDTTPQPGTYYTCPSVSCSEVAVPIAQQLTNPIVKFPKDNNGLVYELPSLPGGQEATATGALIFGIGTESNNAVGIAKVYTLNSDDNFQTVFESQTLPASFIDSGSNGLFFPSSYNVCTDNPSFYCDSQTAAATNTGVNGATGAVDFTIANADTLFSGTDVAFSDLGGPNANTYPCSGATCSFDWGLSFFFGRNVFTSIDGQTVTGEPAPPWWAY